MVDKMSVSRIGSSMFGGEEKTYQDRKQAGQELAENLVGEFGEKEGIVLALPCGGVPVSKEVAARLGWPLLVLVVRNL